MGWKITPGQFLQAAGGIFNQWILLASPRIEENDQVFHRQVKGMRCEARRFDHGSSTFVRRRWSLLLRIVSMLVAMVRRDSGSGTGTGTGTEEETAREPRDSQLRKNCTHR